LGIGTGDGECGCDEQQGIRSESPYDVGSHLTSWLAVLRILGKGEAGEPTWRAAHVPSSNANGGYV
jgi:hypothetical protein